MIAGMVEIVETPEQKLKRHEDALVACMAEITRLREENARLRSSENTAHSVLREVYNDPTASPAVRVKAAGLALPHETPRLMPERAPLELTAAAADDPDAGLSLAELVEKRRKRCDEAYAKDPQFQAWRDSRGFLLTGNGSSADGNGGTDSSGNTES
jgi:hypothetical protein